MRLIDVILIGFAALLVVAVSFTAGWIVGTREKGR